jgi:hypothetical protein
MAPDGDAIFGTELRGGSNGTMARPASTRLIENGSMARSCEVRPPVSRGQRPAGGRPLGDEARSSGSYVDEAQGGGVVHDVGGLWGG